MIVSGIPGDVHYFLWVLVFLTEFFSKWLCYFFSITFSPFYGVILESQGTIDSPILLPGYQSLFCAHRPEDWAFPCFSFFLPFDSVSSKAHGWLFYSEVCLFFMSPSLWFNFWSSSFFVIFLEWAESNSVGSKVFAATSFFIAPCSDSPRYRSFAPWEITLGFLLFLAGSLVPKKDVSALCFLCFFGVFLWAVLILS